MELMVQYCYNQDEQPVNILSKHWKNSDYIPIGRVKISNVIDGEEIIIEKLSFNPFESSEGLEPVGRIQKLRDKSYVTSFSERNQ